MRLPIIALLFVFLSFAASAQWTLDFSKAKNTAISEHKLILLSFSGSDWCGPCIRMRKEIFEDSTFIHFASAQLVLLNADFPRQKKNQLSKAQQQQNDNLAETYNKNGIFPLTLLLNEEGKVLLSWEGFQKDGAVKFVSQINDQLNGK